MPSDHCFVRAPVMTVEGLAAFATGNRDLEIDRQQETNP